MLDILNLAFPFFGLILIGFACGKLRKIPDAGLAWMNFFILYVSLPALFFRILSKTPFEQLAQIDFVKATVLATAGAFFLSFLIGLVISRGRMAEATLGPEAAAPVALIFCFDALLIFALTPLLMAFSGAATAGLGRALLDVVRSIVFNPLLISAGIGAVAAAYHFEPPVAVERLLAFLYTSAAPCALFALGVTVALRPMQRRPPEVPLLSAVKLMVHPALVLALLPLFGTFSETWVSTAVLMAALPPALTAYVFARHYNTWIEQASGVVLFGTLFSVATLMVVMGLVQSHMLPQLMPKW